MIQPKVASSAAAMTAVSSQEHEDLVARRPDRLAELLQPLALQRPAAAERAGNFAQHELVDRLAHARADAVLRRRDVHVMAAVVLDAEVAVADQSVHDLGGDAVGAELTFASGVARVHDHP